MKPYYECDGITIFNADWRSCEFPVDGSYDLLLTDCPYGIGEARGKNKSRTNLAVAKDYGISDWDDKPPSEGDILWMRSLAKHQIIFGGNYFHLPPSSCWLVWDKINSGDFADCELAWTNLDKAVRIFRYMWNGMIREGNDVRVHPCQKPLALMKFCLTMVPKDIKTVIDPFCGSGTTLVAAKAAGLKAVGCELSEEYAEAAAKRLDQAVFNFESSDTPMAEMPLLFD